MVHLTVYGNAHVLKVRSPGPDGPNSGVITDLKPINPDRVQVKMLNGQKIFMVTRVDAAGNIDNSSPPLELSINEIMHVVGTSYDGVAGIGVVQQARRTLGTAMAADRLAAKFYSRGSMLSGIINVKAPLKDQTQADSSLDR